MSTKVFTDYNSAVSFASKQGIKAIGKPYRKLVWLNGTQVPVWCVPVR